MIIPYRVVIIDTFNPPNMRNGEMSTTFSMVEKAIYKPINCPRIPVMAENNPIDLT